MLIEKSFFPLNLCLVIDRSGSMNETMGKEKRINGAKEAVMGVIASLLPQDRISLVSFSDDSTLEISRSSIEYIKSNSDIITTKINEIQPKGGTSFSSGLELALKQIDANDMDSIPTILFMSDGHNNTGFDFRYNVSECKRKRIPIYTVGFASKESEVGVDNLSYMSSQTGGRYVFVDDIFELKKAFLNLQQNASYWTYLDSYIGEVKQNETLHMRSYNVVKYVGSLRFTLTWPGSDLDLILVDPDGKIVNFSDPNVYYAKDQNPEYVIIYYPKPGEWAPKVYGKEVIGISEPFYLRVSSYYPPPPEPLSPAETWIKNFGGSKFDTAYSVQQTDDGGYVVVGVTESYGNGKKDVWLLKADPYGSELWNRTFGGSGDDEGRSVQQTSDGYIIVGSTESHGNCNKDLWLIKTDSMGYLDWETKFGKLNYDGAHSVEETRDGGFIIVGRTSPNPSDERQDLWLIKTDSKGIEEWNRTTKGKFVDDSSVFVRQTRDDGYIITGSTDFGHIDNYDILLMKWDSAGNEEWNRTIGGQKDEGGRSVQETSDGGYIITGWTTSYGSGRKDAWLIKTNSAGIEMWNRTYGHGSSNDEEGECVQQTIDGGYIITGWTESNSGTKDVLLIKTNTKGKIIWEEPIVERSYDVGRSVQQTRDGGYIIAGFTNSYGDPNGDIFLIKTDSDGKVKKK